MFQWYDLLMHFYSLLFITRSIWWSSILLSSGFTLWLNIEKKLRCMRKWSTIKTSLFLHYLMISPIYNILLGTCVMACLFVIRNIETSSSIQFSTSYHHHSYLTLWWKHGVTFICAKPNLTQPVTVNLWQSQDLKRARICEECHIFRNSFTLFPCDCPIWLQNIWNKSVHDECGRGFGFTTEHEQWILALLLSIISHSVMKLKPVPHSLYTVLSHISCGQVGQSSQGNRVNEFLKMWPVIVTIPLQLATGKSMCLLISK